MFKTSLFILIALFSFFYSAQAQVSAYTFSQNNTAYSAITGGTVHGTGTIDDNNYNNIALGFTFTYNCQNFTAISINCNGFIYYIF